MSSLSEEFTHKQEHRQKQMLVSGGHICAPGRGTNYVSLQSFINLGKTNVFPNISHMSHCIDLILGILGNWSGVLYIYLHSFPRF